MYSHIIDVSVYISSCLCRFLYVDYIYYSSIEYKLRSQAQPLRLRPPVVKGGATGLVAAAGDTSGGEPCPQFCLEALLTQ